MSEPLRLLVTVGSDHHRFDRLIGWVDDWLAAQPPGLVDATVQHATAAPSRVARSVAYLPHDELLALEGAADAVVMQGGPLGVVESRRQGRRPIVVPRLRRLDEVVDDHQVTFCRRVAQDSTIALAESEEELHRLLDAMLTDRTVYLLDAADDDARVAESVARFAELVRPFEQLSAGPSASASRGEGPRVLFLGGFGRSGSTMLERVLATTPGVVALGEVVHLWERGLRDDERCGCGKHFSDCPFWAEVGQRAFGGWTELDADEMVALRWAVDRNRFIPRLLLPWRGRYGTAARRYREVLDRLYAAARDVSGAEVLVDSSKNPSYVYLLRRCRLRLRTVHLVRDARGVTYSWTKQVRRPEITGTSTYMPTYPPARSGLLWDAHNLLMTLFGWTGGRSIRVRYEDFTREPDEVLARLRDHAGLATPSATELDRTRTVRLGVDHTVAGNPMRFTVGEVELRADDAWVRELAPDARRSVLSVTWPLLAWYGYPLRRRASAR